MSVDFKIVIETREATRNLRDINTAVDGVSKKVGDLKRVLNSLTDMLKSTAAGLGVALGVKELISDIVKLTGQFQQVEVAMTTLLGSAEKAQALIGQMKETAVLTPFSYMEVANGAKQLVAYGVAAEDVNETLKDLGDIAAGMGRNLGELIFLYGTTIRQNHMYTVDLRQFLGRGIPIGEYLAKQLNIGQNALQDYVRAGKVTAEVFDAAIKEMANTKFANLMEEQSKTVSGRIEKIKDTIQIALADLGESNVGIINTSLDVITKLVQNYKEIGSAISDLLVAYGAYKTTVITLSAIEKAHIAYRTAFIGVARKYAAAHLYVTSAMVQEEMAMNALNKVLLKNPYVLAGAAIATLALGIWKYTTAANAAKVAQDSLNDSLSKMVKDAEDKKQKIQGLIQAIKSPETTPLDKQLAYEDLKNIAPAITDLYDSIEKLSKADLTKTNEQINELLNTDRENAIRSQITALQEYIELLHNRGGGLNIDERNAGEKVGITGNWTWMVDERNKYEEAAQLKLIALQEQLDKINKAKEVASQPTTIDIDLAKDRYEQTMSMVTEFSELVKTTKNSIEGNPAEFPFTTDQADNLLNNLEDKINALKEEQNKNPIEFTATGKDAILNEYQTMLDNIKTWKATAASTGIFTVPFVIEMQIKRLREQANKDKASAEGANESVETYRQAVANARKRLKDATRELNTLLADPNALASKVASARKKKKSAQGELDSLLDSTEKQRNTAASKTNTEAKKRAEEQAKFRKTVSEEEKRWNEEEKERTQQSQYAIEQARIDIMDEGTQKTLEQLALNHKKELDQIEKERDEMLKSRQEHAKTLFEANPKNKGKIFENTKEYEAISLSEDDIAGLQAKVDSANAKFKASISEIGKAEYDANISYLKDWGTYQQKKLAIAEEYAEKIKRATTEGEKKRLQKEEQKAYGDLDFEQMKKEMNWEVLFGNLNALTKKELGEYKKMLDDFRKSDKYNTLDLVNKKEFEKKYKEIVSAGNEKGGLFGGLTQAIKDYELALRDLAIAQEEYNAAVASGDEEAMSAAREKMTTAQGNVVSNRQKKKDAEETTYNKLMTINDAIVSLGNASEYSVADLGKLVSTVSSAFGEVAGKVGGIIGAILAIVDSIGEQDVDEWADGIATKLGTAIGSAFDSKYSLLHYVAGGLLGSSDKTLTSDIENLTTANESLQAAIEDLADTMDGLSIPEATEALAAQLESVSKMEANTQEIMSRMAANYSNGFLGIGGSQSSNNAIDEWFRAADLASTNKTFRAFAGDEYDGYENSWEKISELVGKSIDSAGDFFSLSAKEMLSVKENLPYIYEKIKELADDGYKDAAQYMDAYTEYAEQVQELEEAYQEKITATSFDTIKDDFRSALTDMDSDAEDFSNNFEKYMREAVVESLMTSLYDDRLKSWYEKFASAMKSGGELTNSERDALEEEYNDIVSDALAMRDELENMGLISDDSDSSQSSSYGESSSITQDQASEISGRLTAVQWSGEQRLVVLNVISQAVLNMNVLATGNNTFLSEMRNLTLANNGYLADIQKDTRKMYNEWSIKFDKMEKSLEKL